jgi:hypothetical protein
MTRSEHEIQTAKLTPKEKATLTRVHRTLKVPLIPTMTVFPKVFPTDGAKKPWTNNLTGPFLMTCNQRKSLKELQRNEPKM